MGEESKEGRCYACGGDFPQSVLKRCSRCLLVRYCSRECQKVAWVNGHNKSCKPRAQLTKALGRWMDIWRVVLCHFAGVSLDLSNHPADYNATHMMVIWITKRLDIQNPPSPQMFRVTKGDVWPLILCDAMWPELEFTPAKDMGINFLRLVVVLEDWAGDTLRVRTSSWRTASLPMTRRLDKEDSKYFAENWLQSVQDIIEKGDVSVKAVYDKLHREAAMFSRMLGD
ncbi:hypothetical protein BDN72DRAFT_849035 [Pluteus cervinus]|uniref:Uncharacterized protein n=1 Tax=Pluteus cervinus TaxID=181527 RepID=A0ACD3A8R5_9AGAR|nr:hypothetical protein BDN72DRAFT_849035 [Pluteus cervinus]